MEGKGPSLFLPVTCVSYYSLINLHDYKFGRLYEMRIALFVVGLERQYMAIHLKILNKVNFIDETVTSSTYSQHHHSLTL